MLRVFLVIDDYNELIYLQTLLKKLGFDVEGLQNQKKYADLSLGFNPQIVITTARGKKVDGLKLAQSIHKRRGLPKIVALRTGDQTFYENEFAEAGVDQVLDSPINPKKLILSLSTLGDIDEAQLMEKYSKIKGLVAPGASDAIFVTYDENGQPVDSLHNVRANIDSLKSDNTQAPLFPIQKDSTQTVVDTQNTKQPQAEDPERAARFARWTELLGKLPESHFDRERILNFNKKIRATEPPEDIKDIQDERKKFVKALFKK
jgi:response regulator RpfG family c-di-GMP phosphodiesterase